MFLFPLPHRFPSHKSCHLPDQACCSKDLHHVLFLPERGQSFFHTKPDLFSKGKLAMLMISPLVWKIRPSCCWPWPGFCPLPRQVPAKIFYVKCESLPSGTFTGNVVIECIYQRDKTVYSTGQIDQNENFLERIDHLKNYNS